MIKGTRRKLVKIVGALAQTRGTAGCVHINKNSVRQVLSGVVQVWKVCRDYQLPLEAKGRGNILFAIVGIGALAKPSLFLQILGVKRFHNREEVVLTIYNKQRFHNELPLPYLAITGGLK